MKYYGRVLKEVVQDPDLSIEAKGLYALIASLCGAGNECYPTVGRLAQYLGKSRCTVHRLLKQLVEKRAIYRYEDPTTKKVIIELCTIYEKSINCENDSGRDSQTRV
jgi:DNA-binding MarR family transcriptional regulator